MYGKGKMIAQNGQQCFVCNIVWQYYMTWVKIVRRCSEPREEIRGGSATLTPSFVYMFCITKSFFDIANHFEVKAIFEKKELGDS